MNLLVLIGSLRAASFSRKSDELTKARLQGTLAQFQNWIGGA